MAKVGKPAPAPAPKANKPSAAPGTKDEKAEKKQRVSYPGLFDAEGDNVKLKDIPADFNPKEHKPLKRTDFEDESLWFELRARDLEDKAKRLREAGQEAKKLGNVKDRAKAKRLINMQKRMAELAEQLKSQGIDVDSLLGSSAAAEEDGEAGEE